MMRLDFFIWQFIAQVVGTRFIASVVLPPQIAVFFCQPLLSRPIGNSLSELS